jgi:gamma-glutamyltranspeptidase/glutathione hydrolase
VFTAQWAGLIDDRGYEPKYYGTHDALPTDGGTSHVSVIDPFGGGVAMTETISFEFGSKVAVEELGFCLNNEMDDFTSPNNKPNDFGLAQSDRNLPEVGKRPLSCMSPTIMVDGNGEIVAIAGASGGPRIITGTMQALINVMAGMDAGRAVSAPRLHHQWIPNEVLLEGGLSALVQNAMGSYGQAIGNEGEVVGNVQMIVRNAEDGKPKGGQAASDPRKGGRPSGIE